MEKDKRSEEDTHKTQMLEMARKVKLLEQQLKEVPDSQNSDVLKELQVVAVMLEFSVMSAKKSFKKLHFWVFSCLQNLYIMSNVKVYLYLFLIMEWLF